MADTPCASQNTEVPSKEVEPDTPTQQAQSPIQPEMGACASAVGATKSPKTISPATSQNELPIKDAKEVPVDESNVNKDATMPTDTNQATSKPDVVPDGPVDEQCNSPEEFPPPTQLSIAADSKHFKEAATTPTHPAEKSLQNAMKDFEQTAEDLAAEVSKTKAVLQEQEQIPNESTAVKKEVAGEVIGDGETTSTTEEALAEAITNEILQEVSNEVEKVQPESTSKPEESECPKDADKEREETTTDDVNNVQEDSAQKKPESPTIKVQEVSSPAVLQSEVVPADATDVIGEPAEDNNTKLDTQRADPGTSPSAVDNVNTSAEKPEQNSTGDIEEAVNVVEQSSVADEIPTNKNTEECIDGLKNEESPPEATSELEEAPKQQNTDDIETKETIGNGTTELNVADDEKSAVDKKSSEESNNILENDDVVKNGLSAHEMYNYLLKLQREVSAMQIHMTKLQENMRSTSKVLQVVIASTEKGLGL